MDDASRSWSRAKIKKTLQRIVLLLLLTAVGGCASTPALHVIGVYEGQTPPGVDDRPWWARCGDTGVGEGVVTFSSSTTECDRASADEHVEKEVSIRVSDDSRPLVLALTAYDRTHWKVTLERGVRLGRVILGGYHAQRVSGIPSGIPIEVYTYDPSPCEYCWQGANYFYSYERPPEQLWSITGLEVTSFQGRYTGSEFSIFRGLEKTE